MKINPSELLEQNEVQIKNHSERFDFLSNQLEQKNISCSEIIKKLQAQI